MSSMSATDLSLKPSTFWTFTSPQGDRFPFPYSLPRHGAVFHGPVGWRHALRDGFGVFDRVGTEGTALAVGGFVVAMCVMVFWYGIGELKLVKGMFHIMKADFVENRCGKSIREVLVNSCRHSLGPFRPLSPFSKNAF